MNYLLGLVVLVVGALLAVRRKGAASMLPRKESKAIFEGLSLRNCDAWGCGHFNAPRGSRFHKGLDIAVQPNAPVYAPFDCQLTRIGRPYVSDNHYLLLEIEGTMAFKGSRVKMMYVAPLSGFQIGHSYKQGERIGTAQHISAKYSETMTNHYHFELYENGVLTDPQKYIN